MSIADATSRISAIQAQITALTTAFVPSAPTSSASSASTGSAGTFASQLASAQATAAGTLSSSSPVAGALDVSATGTSSLPAAASGQLTSSQQQFASRLAADTGLNSGVVSAWLLAEESGSAAQSRQTANNNDWLNIGYTDGGTYGATDSVWSDPVAAADATAGWLKGQNTIPGYGTASAGIQAILATAGQDPSTQISALQNSGWASSGYPSLPSLYQSVVGA